MAAETYGEIIGGKYRLLSVLGEGAMGVVYRAEQLDAEGQSLREVALKMVQPGFSRDLHFAQRFLREVRVAARLRSPHSVMVHDTGQTDAGQFYYAMELVEGLTLREVLHRHGPLPVGRVVRIVGQVCEALAEAHSLPEPIVHRDLKPANIFVETRQGQDWAKVGDFGIAKVLGEHTSGLTHTGASPGTPRYMAPEQWMGKAVDGRADLYALGAMLYELLTGKAPFVGEEGPLALMYQHLHEPPPPLPDSIPAGVRLQVERLLAKAPQDRPANALAVRQTLEAALTGEDERSTIVLEKNRGASIAVTDLATGAGRVPLVAEQETLAPRTLMQPPTVVEPQPRAVSTRSRTRGTTLWWYVAAAGSVLVLGLMIGGLWDRFQQPAQEARQQPEVEQGISGQKPLRPTETAQGTQVQIKDKGAEQVAPQSPQGQQLQDQAKAVAPESAEDIRRKAEERQKAEVAQRIATLSEQARQQRAAKRLTTPAGDNAVETYRELLRVVPEHAEALAGLNEVKGQYRQWAEETQQRGEWVKAQGHYETALKIDPQDETLTAALQQVKKARKQAEAIAGWYETTTSTPVLKEPRPDAAVITTLTPQKRVHVAGAVGDYVKIESVRGNPAGYLARQNVMPVQERPETSGAIQQAAVEKSTTEAEQRSEISPLTREADAILRSVIPVSKSAQSAFVMSERSRVAALAGRLDSTQRATLESFARQGNQAMHQKRYQAVVETSKVVLSYDPDSFSVLADTAGAYYELGQPDTAIEYAIRAIRRCPTPEVYFVVASAYVKKGDKKRALSWLDTAIKGGLIEQRPGVQWGSQTVRQAIEDNFAPLRNDPVYVSLMRERP